MTKIYRWVPGGRKITPEDWNLFADHLEKEHKHRGTDSAKIPEPIDILPPANEENYGRLVILNSDGQLYFCVPA